MEVGVAPKGSMLKPIVVLAALALAVPLAIWACGSSDEAATEGGSITIAQTSQPDYLDPALSYTVNGWEPMWIVYTPLLTYRHEEGQAGIGADPRPGRGPADRLQGRQDLHAHTPRRPQVLRRDRGQGLGLRAHDPAGAEPRAPAARPSSRASSARRSTRARTIPTQDIKGIETDDKTGEITITLEEPDASFSNVLAMNFAGLVPGRHPVQEPDRGPARRASARTRSRSRSRTASS